MDLRARAFEKYFFAKVKAKNEDRLT